MVLKVVLKILNIRFRITFLSKKKKRVSMVGELPCIIAIIPVVSIVYHSYDKSRIQYNMCAKIGENW